jgi:hypothetical protein
VAAPGGRGSCLPSCQRPSSWTHPAQVQQQLDKSLWYFGFYKKVGAGHRQRCQKDQQNCEIIDNYNPTDLNQYIIPCSYYVTPISWRLK